MTAPTRVGFSAITGVQNNTLTGTVVLPAHLAGDVGLLFVYAVAVTATMSINGWTPLRAHWDHDALARYWLFGRVFESADEPDPILNRSTSDGDMYARAGVWSGVDPVDPWEVIGVPVATDTEPVTIPGLTSLTAEALIVAFSGYRDDNTASATVTATDPSTFAADYAESSVGADGSIAIADAPRAVAGATGNLTVNYNVAFTVGRTCGGIAVALRPASVAEPQTIDLGRVALTASPRVLAATMGGLTRQATRVGLAVSPRTMASLPGALTRPASRVALTLAPRAPTSVPGGISRSLDRVPLTLTPRSPTTTPGALTRELIRVSLTLALHAPASAQGATLRSLTTLSLTLTPQDTNLASVFDVALDRVSLTVTPRVSATAMGALSRELNRIPLDLTPRVPAIMLGALDRTLGRITLPLAPQDTTASPGPLTRGLTSVTLALLPRGPDTSGVVVIGLDRIALALTPRTVTGTAGSLNRVLGRVPLDLTPRALSANMGPISRALDRVALDVSPQGPGIETGALVRALEQVPLLLTLRAPDRTMGAITIGLDPVMLVLQVPGLVVSGAAIAGLTAWLTAGPRILARVWAGPRLTADLTSESRILARLFARPRITGDLTADAMIT